MYCYIYRYRYIIMYCYIYRYIQVINVFLYNYVTGDTICIKCVWREQERTGGNKRGGKEGERREGGREGEKEGGKEGGRERGGREEERERGGGEGEKEGGREGGRGRERRRQVMKYCSAIEAVEVQSEKDVLEVWLVYSPSPLVWSPLQ